MIFELHKTSAGIEIGTRFTAQAASALGVREKAIEDWIASNPDMLFQTEKLLVIGQSISGQSMADVLALDASGALVVVEVKRDWSDRETVGQLLEYAASMHHAPYERLNSTAQRYVNWQGGSLIERFREFAAQPEFPQDQLAQRSRVIIVAPDSDQGLRSISACRVLVSSR